MNHFYASQNMPALVDETVTYTLTFLIDASSLRNQFRWRRTTAWSRHFSCFICQNRAERFVVVPAAAPFSSVGNEKQTPEKWWGEFKFIFLPSLRPEKQKKKPLGAHFSQL